MLRSGIRPYDICVRYAGDEFVVVLSGCGAEEAQQKQRELQQAIADIPFEVRPGASFRSEARSEARSFRATAKPTKACWPRPTSGCIRTRRSARRSDLGQPPEPVEDDDTKPRSVFAKIPSQPSGTRPH